MSLSFPAVDLDALAEVAALAAANRARKLIGLPPVTHLEKGNTIATSCPITNTIKKGDAANTYVHTTASRIIVKGANPGSTETRFSNDPSTQRFVEKFDGGAFPQYVA